MPERGAGRIARCARRRTRRRSSRRRAAPPGRQSESAVAARSGRSAWSMRWSMMSASGSGAGPDSRGGRPARIAGPGEAGQARRLAPARVPVRVLFTRYPAERAGPSPASRAAPSSERTSPLPATDTYPQHVVTAVIVAHDGHAWLPQLADSLLEQTRPVQRVVAVDTGSRDRSGSVLVGKLGQGAVFGMERGTGFGAAVARAVAHRAARTRIPLPSGLPSDDRVEWLWLLHDDCEPAADALEQLLRGAVETRQAAVIGPKLMDWSDRRVILEAGVTIDTAGRRITGIEPREVDQGQHDGDRDVLAVSSAGMLVRRDVWEHLGGFDPAMPLFRDDVDFCWRVHAAGYRVRLVTDAVVYHVEASARRRRPISVTRRPQQADRRHALVTLLGNLPQPHMLAAAAHPPPPRTGAPPCLRQAPPAAAARPVAAADRRVRGGCPVPLGATGHGRVAPCHRRPHR